MSDAEKILHVVPKAYTSLEQWMLFITNYRVIVTRFDAWGTAFGSAVGHALDERKRKKMVETDPNEILATQKNSFAIDYSNITSINCKKSFTGSNITFSLNDGTTKKYGMPKKDYLKVIEVMSPLLESKIVSS